ncbi:RNA polymerase II C-terminal domain phosphatase-like 2 [Hordeum vulgare]|nr:RNA polymerase II C-terminal domain phosphatase-like 2 [Hordeum vulgare]
MMAAAGAVTRRSMPLFDGDVFLGDVDVLLPPGTESASSSCMDLHQQAVFPSNEIRISRRSPASERCPPLAVLQVISAYSLRCKLQAKAADLHPKSLLRRLHDSCWKKGMTAVVEIGEEELHLVAMQSKQVKGLACFWCWSAPAGLYAACLQMLNKRCLALVLDLDETVVFSNTAETFESRLDRIMSGLENSELDAANESAMSDEFNRTFNDKQLLVDFNETGTITLNFHQTVRCHGEQAMFHKPSGHHEFIIRPVIRVPGRNAVLTRLAPMDPSTGHFVNIRPGWDDLKRYLITTSGRQRFKVYVCTMAGRAYALEIWRLLDPEGSLISLREISQRLICVRPDSKKSLERVFRDSLCHPSMAMVLDDRRDVWDERDKRRVFAAPAYKPLVAPADKVVNGYSALQILTKIACHARKGFFSEFDGMLLKNINELVYENEVLDLPYSPDISDYLQFKNNNTARQGVAPILRR